VEKNRREGFRRRKDGARNRDKSGDSTKEKKRKHKEKAKKKTTKSRQAHSNPLKKGTTGEREERRTTGTLRRMGGEPTCESHPPKIPRRVTPGRRSRGWIRTGMRGEPYRGGEGDAADQAHPTTMWPKKRRKEEKRGGGKVRVDKNLQRLIRKKQLSGPPQLGEKIFWGDGQPTQNKAVGESRIVSNGETMLRRGNRAISKHVAAEPDEDQKRTYQDSP